MARALAEIVARDTAADGAQEAALAFGHGRRVGVVVGGLRVGGLRGELVGLAVRVVDLGRRAAVLAALLWGVLALVLAAKRRELNQYSILEREQFVSISWVDGRTY